VGRKDSERTVCFKVVFGNQKTTLKHTVRSESLRPTYRIFLAALRLDWIVQCFTSPPTQYRLYGRRFYRSKDPTNSIKVLKEATKENNTKKQRKHKIHMH